MKFSTYGFSLKEREQSYVSGNIVPIGTICFKATASSTIEIVVDEINQKEVSMYWDSLYFKNKIDADLKSASLVK